MYYEINVSLHGTHLFATAERSITSQFELDRIAPIIAKKFPARQGYAVTCVRYEIKGKEIPLPKE